MRVTPGGRSTASSRRQSPLGGGFRGAQTALGVRAAVSAAASASASPHPHGTFTGVSPSATISRSPSAGQIGQGPLDGPEGKQDRQVFKQALQELLEENRALQRETTQIMEGQMLKDQQDPPMPARMQSNASQGVQPAPAGWQQSAMPQHMGQTVRSPGVTGTVTPTQIQGGPLRHPPAQMPIRGGYPPDTSPGGYPQKALPRPVRQTGAANGPGPSGPRR